jgi:ssDNA-binding Zn-finger/Zn-ribbon topoisomerase 1
MGKYTTEQLFEIFHAKHGNKYTYPSDLTEFKIKDKIPIFCTVKDHGIFYQSIKEHKKGQGCPKCRLIKIINAHILSREVWIERFEKLHGKGKYDYSKLPQYPGANLEFPIYCVEHGVFFNQTPNHHLYFKQGCPKCGSVTRWKKIKNNFISRKDFVNQSRAKNGLGYEYINLPKDFSLNDTIGIFCLAHNKLFFCKASEHLKGKGCPICEYEK